MILEKLGNEIIESGLKLFENHLVARTWGNISGRASGTALSQELFLITPSGRAYDEISKDDLVLLDYNCNVIAGYCKPSSEKKVHGEIYKVRPDVTFIIHTHQYFASALSLSGDYNNNKLPISKNAMAGSDLLAANIADVAKLGTDIILMEGHGAMILGTSAEDTLNKAINLEAYCKSKFVSQYWDGGDPSRLEIKEIKVLSSKSFISIPFPVDHYLVELSSPVLAAFENGLAGYIDDFSQIIGIESFNIGHNEHKWKEYHKISPILKSNGIYSDGHWYCTGKSIDDAYAAALILYKNALAAIVAKKTGHKAISFETALALNSIYLNSYSNEINYGKNVNQNKNEEG